MRKSDLLRHNASHLVVFQSLLETGNVTATATQLHMSQPAVSRALAHLRTMFDDALFVRAPGGVVATERARQLSARTGLISCQLQGDRVLLSGKVVDFMFGKITL